MAEVWAIINHKGGTTKTTATEHISSVLIDAGCSVCLLDLDTSHNLTNFHLETLPKKNVLDFLNGDKKAIQKISTRLSLVAGTKKISKFDDLYYAETDVYAVIKNAVSALPFDFVLIDTPHAIGNIIKNAAYAADKIIIPAMPTRDSADGTVDVMDEIRELKKQRPDAKCIPYILPSGVTWYSLYERDAIKAIKAAHKGVAVLPSIPYKKSITYDQSDRIVRKTSVYRGYKEVVEWLLNQKTATK